MKKTLALALALLLIPLSALAATLSIDLTTASLEELQAAQAAITARIAEIQAYATTAPESDSALADGIIEFSGEGVSMLDGFSIGEGLFRLVMNCEDKAKVSTYVGDALNTAEYLHSDVDFGKGPISVDSLMVETSGKWSLNISPIVTGGQSIMSGEGPQVGDLFTLDKPQIVTITATGTPRIQSYFNSAYIYLCKVGSNGYIDRESMLSDSVDDGKSISVDAILKPDSENTGYFWLIKCSPGISWNIAIKG